MADLIDHIEALSANIGPRPVSTEEEHQASCYVAQELSDAGLEVDMDEFATPSGVNWPFGIAFVLMIVGTVLSGFGLFLDGVSTAFLAVGLVLLVVGAIIYFAEHSDHPLLSNAFNRGVSQNVVAKYVPSSLARENRRRKVIIVAHVDTVRSELQANPTIVNYFPTYTKALYYTTIGLLVLLVIRLFPIPWPDTVDLVLWIISLVGCLVPLVGVVCIVAHKLLPYVEGANDNASGVAVMLDVAHRILDPRERERLSQEMADEQAAGDAAAEDEETLTPQPVVHDAEAAAAAGVVAEGAELEYATDAKDADAEAPDATKVMPALDADAAAEEEPVTAAPSAAAEDAVPEDSADEDASVLEFPHPVSEAAIGSSKAAPAAEAEQAPDEAAEVVDADYEDAAVAEVNDAEREARFAALDEAQTAMQPRPHPKHEPGLESEPEPEPEPEPDPSTAGMPAWYVAARQQAAREKPASDESDAEAVAASRSRYADIPLEGVSDLNASEEVIDAEEEVAEEEAPEQPLEEPPSAYAASDEEEEAPAPAAEAEEHEEAPAAEEAREEEPEPAAAAESAQEAEPDTSAAPATEQPSTEEASSPAAAESAAAPAASETSDTAEPAAAEAAAPETSDTAEPAVAEAAAAAEAAEPSTPAAPAAEEKPADEAAASAAPSTEQPPATEAAAPKPDEASAAVASPAADSSAPAAAESEHAAEAATAKAAAEEPESPAKDAASEAARELPTRIPAIGSSGSVSSEKRVSQLRSELESSIAGNARGSAPVARTHKDTKDAAPARRKPTARRVTEAFQPTKAVEDREEGFTGVTQAAAVSSTYEGTPQAGATPEQDFDPFAPSPVPEPPAPATPQPISPSTSSQFPTVSPAASSQFPTVSPSASSQFPTVSPSASSQFPTVSPSASTQFPTVPASAAVNPSDFGAPAAPADPVAPAPAAPAAAPAANQADFAAPTNPAPTAMPQEPEPVEEYATLDPEIAVPQSRFRDALDGVAGAFGRIGRRNRHNQDREIDYGGWSNNEEASGGNDNDDEDIGWKGGAYYDGEADDEMQDAGFEDMDASVPPAEDSADELHPGRSGSFDSSAIDSARARAAEIRESIVTMTEHDLLDKEVWFVALGASSANNRGMRNFLDLHATELRGSLIINLEAVGAGDICYVDLEGRGKVERADRRLQTLVRKASKDLGEVMSAETLTWRDTDATPAMRAGLRAMTIMGFDGVAPTAWHWHTDTTLILDDNALDYTTKLILKMIENS